MILAIDYDGKGDESPSVYIIKRNADGTFDDRSDIQLIAAYKQCEADYYSSNQRRIVF